MLKKIKQTTLSSLKAAGVFKAVRTSKWRNERLLILAYHGLSLLDEHEWNPELFMHPELFHQRMRILKESGCTVLPLGEAIKRLYANDLPENSVALTFDDGYHDFYRLGVSIIKEFDLPVTLYLTTYYVNYNRPIFDGISSYILWKGRWQTLKLSELIGVNGDINLSSQDSRNHAYNHLINFARKNNLSAQEKDNLAAKLARQLKIDYDQLLSLRILNLLTPEEVNKLAHEGIDIQLHTHHHNSPLDRTRFHEEISVNRHHIESMTGAPANHFCYPSGIYNPSFLPWLDEVGIVSATTCDPGLASRNSSHLLLPRFIDTSLQSSIEFEGWLTGVSASIPRKRRTYESG
jgi:peptidoglycan/xylan/chitin deacetylase (PgdA/CDA1 family)